jgi:hypothetical protein
MVGAQNMVSPIGNGASRRILSGGLVQATAREW